MGDPGEAEDAYSGAGPSPYYPFPLTVLLAALKRRLLQASYYTCISNYSGLLLLVISLLVIDLLRAHARARDDPKVMMG